MLQNLVENIFSLMQFLFLNIMEVVRNSSGQESRQKKKGVIFALDGRILATKQYPFLSF